MNKAILQSKNKCAKCTFKASEPFADANGSTRTKNAGRIFIRPALERGTPQKSTSTP
jgi:hypothetical protein